MPRPSLPASSPRPAPISTPRPWPGWWRSTVCAIFHPPRGRPVRRPPRGVDIDAELARRVRERICYSGLRHPFYPDGDIRAPSPCSPCCASARRRRSLRSPTGRRGGGSARSIVKPTVDFATVTLERAPRPAEGSALPRSGARSAGSRMPSNRQRTVLSFVHGRACYTGPRFTPAPSAMSNALIVIDMQQDRSRRWCPQSRCRRSRAAYQHAGRRGARQVYRHPRPARRPAGRSASARAPGLALPARHRRGRRRNRPQDLLRCLCRPLCSRGCAARQGNRSAGSSRAVQRTIGVDTTVRSALARGYRTTALRRAYDRRPSALRRR